MAKFTNILAEWHCGVCVERVVITKDGDDPGPGHVLRETDAILRGWRRFPRFALCPEHSKRTLSDEDYFFMEERVVAYRKAAVFRLDFVVYGGKVHTPSGERDATPEERVLWEALR